MKVVNFGCRLNAYEAEIIRGFGDDPALVVLNTCAVTGEAVRQGAQAVRRIARERPDARIVVTGCAAQLDPARFAGLPGVARVLGNIEKLDAANYLFPAPLPSSGRGRGVGLLARTCTPSEAETHPQPLPEEGRGAAGAEIRVGDIMAVRETAAHLLDGYTVHTRAFVEVQQGCDHRCTFCIIPFARGAARSVPAAIVVERIKRLVGGGVQEVVLTGVDLTSYAPSLGGLVQQILRDVPDLPRLRLSSLDSIEIDAALVDAITGDARVMPQLHLSLQAGDDLILKRMKRRHLRDHAIAFCASVRARRPEVAFGADFITGFPTETEAQFEATLALVDECGLSQLHVFPFSPRAGTPAARMPQVAVEVRRERAGRLRALGSQRFAAALAAEVGRPQRILVEGSGDRGHSEAYLPARLLRPWPRGSIAEVVAIGVQGGELECA